MKDWGELQGFSVS